MHGSSAPQPVVLSQDELLVLFAISQAPPISVLTESATAQSPHDALVSSRTAQNGLRARGIITRADDTLRITDLGVHETAAVFARPQSIIELRCETPDAGRRRAYGYFAAGAAVWHTMREGDLHELYPPAAQLTVLQALGQWLQLPERLPGRQPLGLAVHEQVLNAIVATAAANQTGALEQLREAGVDPVAADALLAVVTRPVHRAGVSVYRFEPSGVVLDGYALVYNDAGIWTTGRPGSTHPGFADWQALTSAQVIANITALLG